MSPSAPVRTTCPYCGVGCGVIAQASADSAVTVRGDPAHPANFGRLCSKGSALGETTDLDGRLLYPEISGRRADWDEALDLVTAKFGEAIREHGPNSVAFYVSGQFLTEDYYVANKLMKGFIGSANIDTNSRLCMASSVAGHRRAFGSDTVPGTYEDFELADTVVLVGSNLAWCHPVLNQRLAAAKAERPRMRVVLIDPRRTRTADIADLHLALAPDSDVALFAGLLAWLDAHDRVDRAWVLQHTTGFAEALHEARTWTIAAVATATGLRESEIEAFYRLWSGSRKSVTAYSQGVNQSAVGTDKVNAIINCHLATARIGRPGMGPFSLTGQPNAMGGREAGGLANMLAAHMEIENPEHRDRVRRFWNAPRIADKPGLKAVDLFRAVADGRIKALWIMATNPAVSMPEAGAVEAAIAACPFVVVSDVVSETDTLRHAHVKLPSLAWGEKDGTVTNSERRVSRQRAFLPAPGEAKADWWQLAQVGRRMGFADAFAWTDPAAVFAEHAALSTFENDGARDFDLGAYADIALADYAALAPFQWPQKAGQKPNETRFFGDGEFYTPDRRAHFVAAKPTPVAALAGPARRFILNTGRIRDHWHTMTRTGKTARLSAHIAEPFCEIHPADAGRLGIADADIVRLSAGRSFILVRAQLSQSQRPGSLFVPMHWSDQHASHGRVDRLVAADTDPVSGQPALKAASVELARAPMALYGFAVSAQMPLPEKCDYWARAMTDGGWRMEFALASAPVDPVASLRAMFGETAGAAAESIVYADAKAGNWRIAAFDGPRLLGAAYLSTRPVAVSRSWACAQLQTGHETVAARNRLLAGRPGADLPDKGAIVCACMSIGVNDIAAAARRGCHTVDAVGLATSAGTNCGSCRAEIAEIVEVHRLIAAE